MIDLEKIGLGYLIDQEDRANLRATAKPFNAATILGTFKAPHSISHRGWRKAKYQGLMGSCSGFARASGGEVLNYIATRGAIKRFSEMYCYIENQIAGGNVGSDNGGYIDASMRAAKSTGFCSYELWPYTQAMIDGQYTDRVPASALAEGKQHVVKSHAVMTSYDDVLSWIASGVGVVLTGTPWTTGMRKVGKVMDLCDLGGVLLGGHARVLHGFDGDQVDEDGRPFIDDENSHSDQWADKGFCMVKPRVIDHWLATGAVLIGISDLESFGPRQVVTYQEAMG